MNGWLDWRAIEQQNDWGLREKSDAMAERWNDGAAMWDARWKNDEEFTRQQAEALTFLPDDTVLDVGCGTGPLTMHIAPRVKQVVAFDYGRDMLRLLEQNAAERGLANVSTLQGNWYALEPGEGLPVCDVAVTRWSPAHGDILKFTRCARRWCWSVNTMQPTFDEGGFSTGGYWCRSTVDEDLNTSPRPCARKYGFNVHFNLLYDHGVNPTVNYLHKEHVLAALTRDELLAKLAGPRPDPVKGRPAAPRTDPGAFFAPNIRELDDGSWEFRRRETIVIMGWDPRELQD